MMPWWVLLIFVLGANFALWGTVGLVRLAESLAGRAGLAGCAPLARLARRGLARDWLARARGER